jgi:hypothetical protein
MTGRQKNEPEAYAVGLVLVLERRGDKTGELHDVSIALNIAQSAQHQSLTFVAR